MKKGLIVVLMFNVNLLYSQFPAMSDSCIYIVARGTISKQNLISKKFNIFKNTYTHIGLGLITNDEFLIYNVSMDQKIKNSNLLLQSWDKFKNYEDIISLSIWEYKIDAFDFIIIKEYLSVLKNGKIKFDMQFSLENNDFYCSEFVANVLNKSENLEFKPHKKKLISPIKNILEKDTLSYFPVDFFLENQKFKQVYYKSINLSHYEKN